MVVLDFGFSGQIIGQFICPASVVTSSLSVLSSPSSPTIDHAMNFIDVARETLRKESGIQSKR